MGGDRDALGLRKAGEDLPPARLQQSCRGHRGAIGTRDVVAPGAGRGWDAPKGGSDLDDDIPF